MEISAVWDSSGSGLLLMDLGQESDREGEVVSWEAASSAPGRVANAQVPQSACLRRLLKTVGEKAYIL